MHGVGVEGRQFQLDAVDALADLLASSVVHLFQNVIVPTPTTPTSAFTPANFVGYAPITIATWDFRGVDTDGVAYIASGLLHFEAIDGAVTNTISGAYVLRDQTILTGTVTDATNASPIVITDTAHGLTTGDQVTITGVTGNTAANGTWHVTRIDADTFSLDGSTGNSAYVSGGTWAITPWGPALAGLFAHQVPILLTGDACNCIIKVRADGEVLLLLADEF